mgnify:FL=1|jgi:hypothetical protein
MLKKIKSLIEILARKREVFKMAMVTIYVTLIVAGRRTFDQVPKALKELVKADLEAMGLNEDGQPIL